MKGENTSDGSLNRMPSEPRNQPSSSLRTMELRSTAPFRPKTMSPVLKRYSGIREVTDSSTFGVSLRSVKRPNPTSPTEITGTPVSVYSEAFNFVPNGPVFTSPFPLAIKLPMVDVGHTLLRALRGTAPLRGVAEDPAAPGEEAGARGEAFPPLEVFGLIRSSTPRRAGSSGSRIPGGGSRRIGLGGLVSGASSCRRRVPSPALARGRPRSGPA